MRSYEDTIDDTYRTLGSFSAGYEVDRKRFAHSLKILGTHGRIHGRRVLDLGCGVGILSLALKSLGAEVVGFDKFIFPTAHDNPYRINDFKRLTALWEQAGITVLEGDILCKLPFKDGEFDVVNCDCTIEHLTHSPKSLFKEVNRVLRPGGVFLVTTPNLVNLSRRVRFLVGRSPHWDLQEYFDREERFTGHVRELTLSELRQELLWSGFSIPFSGTQNSFFNWKRLFHPRKWMAHLFTLLSFPFPTMREVLFVLAEKPLDSSLDKKRPSS